jgi:uncharacterized protein YsxB (DUF464 family)
MNIQAIKSTIQSVRDLKSEERRLLANEKFILNLSKVISKISNNDVQIAHEQTLIMIKSILKRYRFMVRLEAREIKGNNRILLQLLNQKIKDGFKTLDKNLNKYKLRNELREKTSKNYQA